MSVTLPTDSMFGLGDYAFAGTAPNDCPDIEAVVDAAIEKRWQDCVDQLREEGAQEALNNVKARIDFLLGWDRETLLPGKDYGIF
ncbi:MAG: hypothetical protein LBI05_11760, partial [Planctomycetaceae bacterium]|nr:hypothetical protein [Planctomycetaceae bacterium]